MVQFHICLQNTKKRQKQEIVKNQLEKLIAESLQLSLKK